MLEVLLVAVVVGGGSVLYVVARGLRKVDRGSAFALAGTGAVIAALAAFIGSSLGGAGGAGGMGGAVAASRDLTASSLVAASPAVDVPIPVPTAFSRIAAAKLTRTKGLVSGGVDSVAFTPANGGSWNWNSHTLRLAPAASAMMTGWAADIDRKSPYGGIIGFIDGKLAVTAAYYVDRLDVAKFMRVPGIRYCGFRLALPPLARGQHILAIGAVNKEGTTYTLMSRSVKVIVS